MACAGRGCDKFVGSRPTVDWREGAGALSLPEVEWWTGGSCWAVFGGADVFTPCCSGGRLLGYVERLWPVAEVDHQVYGVVW